MKNRGSCINEPITSPSKVPLLQIPTILSPGKSNGPTIWSDSLPTLLDSPILKFLGCTSKCSDFCDGLETEV